MTVNKTTRRNFLVTSIAVASGIVGTSSYQQFTKSSLKSAEKSNSTDLKLQEQSVSPHQKQQISMPQRVLGRTGISLPILGLGGSASPLSRPYLEEEAKSIAIIERAYELGIRYFDTAANYGPSEERLGKTLSSHRNDVFLASTAWRK